MGSLLMEKIRSLSTRQFSMWIGFIIESKHKDMTHKSKIKGNRVEREISKRLVDAGISSKRVPLSGAHPDLPGDITIGDFIGEVKARKNGNGFTTIEKWLGTKDVLVLKKNHADPFVVMNWEMFIKIMKGYINEINRSEEGSRNREHSIST